MRLTVATYCFEALPLEGALSLCKWMGFQGVVIAGFHKRGRVSYEPDEVGVNPQQAADHLNALLHRYELDAVDYFPQFGSTFYERSMNDPDLRVRDKNIEMFKGIVQFCKLTRTPGVTLLPGVDHPGRAQEENLDAAGETFRALVEIAGEEGIEVRFEPHMGSLTYRPELALALIKRVPGLKVTLDYSHFVLQYIDVNRVHPLLSHTGHVHVRPTRPGKLQTRFVEATLDFVDIIKRLQALNYQGCLSLEYVCEDWFDANRLDTLSETVHARAALEPYVI